MANVASIEVFTSPPRYLFVRLTDSDGVHGWGEAIVPKRAGAVRAAILELADHVVVGADADRIEDTWQRMRRGAFFRDGPVLATAAAAIEQALWDRKGRARRCAVHDFLGGAVRDRVRSYAWIGGTAEELAAKTLVRERQGFTAVKFTPIDRVDHLPDRAVIDDVISKVAAVRAAAGPKFGVALDLHGRAHRAVTRALLRELEPFGLLWIEEPTAPGGEESLRDLPRTSIPVASGERVTSRWQARDLLNSGLIDILQPDVSLTGLFELEKIARMAEVYDVAVAPHCPNGPVALAASLQVAMCCTNIPILEQGGGVIAGPNGLEPQIPWAIPLTDAGSLTTRDGDLLPPTGFGLGIELDMDEVAPAAPVPFTVPDADWRLPDGRPTEW